jgi:hypothetical protein
MSGGRVSTSKLGLFETPSRAGWTVGAAITAAAMVWDRRAAKSSDSGRGIQRLAGGLDRASG